MASCTGRRAHAHYRGAGIFAALTITTLLSGCGEVRSQGQSAGPHGSADSQLRASRPSLIIHVPEPAGAWVVTGSQVLRARAGTGPADVTPPGLRGVVDGLGVFRAFSALDDMSAWAVRVQTLPAGTHESSTAPPTSGLPAPAPAPTAPGGSSSASGGREGGSRSLPTALPPPPPNTGPAVVDTPMPPTSSEVLTHRTTDGGETWSTNRQTVSLGRGEYVGGSLAVHRAGTAWLMARAQTSSAGSSAVLLRTSDAGATWSTFALPVAGAIRFSTPSHGWLAGGAVANQLYETHDGGETWQAKELPPGAQRSPGTTLTGPHFFTPASGVLPVQQQLDTGGSVLRFFTTTDAGRSWAAKGEPLRVHRGGSIFDGEFSLASFVDESTWYVLADSLLVTRDGGETFLPVRSDRDLSNVSQMAFPSVDDGWVKLTLNPCSGARADTDPHRSDCANEARVLRTSDGGASWVEQPLK